MKYIKIMFAIWFGLMALAPMVEAVDNQECLAAEESAQEAHDRTVEAYNSGNKALSVWHGQAFTKIYESNKNCPYIKALADNLNRIGATKTTVTTVDVGDLMNKCPRCKAEFKTGGGSISTGRGIQKID